MRLQRLLWLCTLLLSSGLLFGYGCGRIVPAASAPPRSQTKAAPPGLFEDVTEKAGISFRHTNGETRYLYPETFGGGCAFLDYNQDGWQDILLLSCGDLHEEVSGAKREAKPPTPNLALYRNNGNGAFTDVTPGSGLDRPLGYAQGLAVGDYDNDGYPDVFVAGYGGCYLFHNKSGSQGGRKYPGHEKTTAPFPLFEDVAQQAGVADTREGPRWASGAAWGDYDNDGRLDLYVCRYAVWSVEGDRKCPRPDGSPGYCVPIVYPGDADCLYRNEGGGRFRDVTKEAGIDRVKARGLAVAWLDYDGDGDADIYVANDLDPNILWRNNGDGTFTDVAVEAGVALGADGRAASGMGIAIGDYDRRGRESLFVTNLNNEIHSLFRNDGGGQFSFVSDHAGLARATLSSSGWGTAFCDIDRDGWLDLLVARGSVSPTVVQDIPGTTYEEPKGVYRNNGDGTFTDITARSGGMRVPRAGRGMAVGDYDNDGRLDALCVNRNDRAELFRNVSPDTNHWISIRLVGVKSNRDGVGAKVWVTTGGIRQYAECRLGSSYASSSDRRLFFGLGAATKVDRVEIRWPGGRRDTLQNLAADGFYVMTEGRGYGRDR